MRLEGFLSLVACIVLLTVIAHCMGTVYRHLQGGVVAVESVPSR